MTYRFQLTCQSRTFYEFLSELSDYVFRAINKTVVQSSIATMVVPEQPKQRKTGPTVNITEIHED